MLAEIRHGQIIRGVALEFEYDADFIGRFVPYIGDLGNLTAADQVGNLLDELGFIDRVG